jgi:hypothetical protein
MESTRLAEWTLQWDRVDPFRDDGVQLRDEPERAHNSKTLIVDRVKVMCDRQESIVLSLRS